MIFFYSVRPFCSMKRWWTFSTLRSHIHPSECCFCPRFHSVQLLAFLSPSLYLAYFCVYGSLFSRCFFFLQFFSLRSAYICHCKSPFINVHLCMYDVFGESNDTYYPFLFPCHLFPLPFSSCMVLLSEIHGDFFLTHFYAKCSCHIRIIFFRLDDLCSIWRKYGNRLEMEEI